MISTTAIVLETTPRNGGGWNAIVRLEQRNDSRVMVVTADRLADGQRVKLRGGGSLWEIEP